MIPSSSEIPGSAATQVSEIGETQPLWSPGLQSSFGFGSEGLTLRLGSRSESQVRATPGREAGCGRPGRKRRPSRPQPAGPATPAGRSPGCHGRGGRGRLGAPRGSGPRLAGQAHCFPRRRAAARQPRGPRQSRLPLPRPRAGRPRGPSAPVVARPRPSG